MINKLVGKISTAYFSMEIGFHEDIPSYSGGLGILAGDTLKGAADLGIPIVGVSLLYRHGFFKQLIDLEGNQIEQEDCWNISKYLTKRKESVIVKVQGRDVKVRVWEYLLKGQGGHVVPLYFLDTELKENDLFDTYISHHLYPKDKQILLNQEVVLGIGGVKILEAMGYSTFDNYHLNETHASLAILALQDKLGQGFVKKHLVFTTHTPISLGHERYSLDQLKNVLDTKYYQLLPQELFENNVLNMALLCLKNSNYANGVANKHKEISRKMYPGYKIDGVTNGVHTATWVSAHIQNLFDEYIPTWRQSALDLRHAIQIPSKEVFEAHKMAKSELLKVINSHLDNPKNYFEKDIITIGFARRAATYKRHNLIFTDLPRLEEIAKNVGKLQFVFAGKAHPADEQGKIIIKQINELNSKISSNIKIIYLPNYYMKLSKLLVSGVDIWLNNPVAPMEASGTSGMKASLNGVPNFSILDGWWLEGHVEDLTGWAIGHGCDNDEKCTEKDLESLYTKLEQKILPIFYHDKEKWANIQKHCIAINASYFSIHRMVMEYVTQAYIA